MARGRIKGIIVEIGGDIISLIRPEKRKLHDQDNTVFSKRREQAP